MHRLGNWFSQSIGFPLLVNGNWRFDKYRSRFKRLLQDKLEMQYWSLEQQRAYQFERLKSLLLHASIKVPYYRDLFASLGFDPLSVRSSEDIKVLPVLTKDIIRENQERLMALDWAERHAYQNFSGGSTGHPASFYQDSLYRDNAEAATWVSDMTAGHRMGQQVAFIWGADRDLSPVRGMKGLIYSLLRNERWFNSFDMSEASMVRYHHAMQQNPPDVIIAYASSAYIFASFLAANHLKPKYPRVSIITSAEVLHDYMREMIESIFGVRVYDRYGSREVGLVASECERHTGLHVNMIDLFVECIGEHVYDQPGELVVTHLNNYTMPFIRYEIEDLVLMEREPCPCGRGAPLLKRVMGRTTDTILTRTGDLIHGEYFTHLFYGVKGVVKFQFIQETLERFKLYIVPGKEFELAVLGGLKEKILKAVGQDCSLITEFVDDIPPTRSGKFLFTVSQLSVSFIAAQKASGDARVQKKDKQL